MRNGELSSETPTVYYANCFIYKALIQYVSLCFLQVSITTPVHDLFGQKTLMVHLNN